MTLFNIFRKLETSKKLTWIILVFWILSIITNTIIILKTNKNINVIVDYINTPLLVIIGSYFGKSMIENVAKIKSVTQSNNNNINENIQPSIK